MSWARRTTALLEASFTPRAIALAIAVLFSIWPHPARAEVPRVEEAAKAALTKAEDLYLGMSFPAGLAVLRKAERACGEDRCTRPTRAALLRDLATFQFRLGDASGSAANFVQALRLVPDLALNPNYDARDLRARWEAAKESLLTASQPGEGDFLHTPPREQKETTPLPIYVEYRGSEQLASVVVKYKSASMSTYKRATLSRLGAGWGGNIPCADITKGVLRYYVQGLDGSGLPTVNSGSPKAPFSVPIHETLSGEAPALPGLRAPETCADEDLAVLRLEIGDRCQEDRQCKSGLCGASGRCARSVEAPAPSGEYARFWLGVSGSVDVAFLPAGQDVCKQAGGAPAGGAYWCTNPDGSDFATGSQNDALLPGRSGATDGGPAPGPVRVLLSVDYAVSPNLLLGIRAGYAAQAYPGQAAIDAGRTLSPAFHGEVRGTYLFGVDPLTLPGLVPYASLGAGYGRFDASARVMVARQNVAGERAVEAWLVGGPIFGAAGAGVRYGLSPRIGFSVGGRATLAFGSGAMLGSVSPEFGLQYGL